MAHSFNRILYSIKDKTTMDGLKNPNGSHKYSFEQKERGKKHRKNKPYFLVWRVKKVLPQR